jgi:hypothetical protein
MRQMRRPLAQPLRVQLACYIPLDTLALPFYEAQRVSQIG